MKGYIFEYSKAMKLRYKLIKMKNSQLTYDVTFNDENDSDSKGFEATEKYCMDYIESWNGTNESYFADYKGGIVSVVCNETGDTIFSTDVK